MAQTLSAFLTQLAATEQAVTGLTHCYATLPTSLPTENLPAVVNRFNKIKRSPVVEYQQGFSTLVYSISVALLLARGEPNLEAAAQNAALDYVEKMPVIVDKDRQFTSTIDGHFTCQTSQYEPVGFGLIRFLDSFWWALVYDIEVTLTSEQ